VSRPHRLRARLRRWFRRSEFRGWFDPAYRLPITGLEDALRLEPRRADFVAWSLAELDVVDARELRRPARISYGDLARVFGVDTWDVPVEEVLHTLRVAAGGDVLEGDHMGALSMTGSGVRARDQRVSRHLAGVPTGGYHPDAWRGRADTVTGVALGAHQEVSPEFEPLSRAFDRIYSTLDPERLGFGELVEPRLGLQGVSLHPSWYHVVSCSRRDYHFGRADRQDRFWEPDPRAEWLTDPVPDTQVTWDSAVREERERTHFTLAA
jgi:hypothetical protein